MIMSIYDRLGLYKRKRKIEEACVMAMDIY